MNTTKIKAAAIRAGRTAAQTFIAVMVAKWLAGPVLVSTLDDVVRANADVAGGTALSAAIVALGWNALRPVSPETK